MRSLLRLIYLLCRPGLVLKSLAFMVALAALWLFINHARLRQYFEDRSRLAKYQDEVSALEHQQAQLIKEKDELTRGGFPAEKAVRERFYLVKPGEKIIFLDGKDSTSPAERVTTASEPVAPASAPRQRVGLEDAKTTRTGARRR